MSATNDIVDKPLAHARRRKHSALLVLLAGLLIFAAAASAAYFALRPNVLRIAVGPKGSDDQKLVQALARTFDRDRNSVRLSVRETGGAAESIAVLQAGKADLAVARGDARATEIDGWRLARTAGRLRLEPVRPRAAS